MRRKSAVRHDCDAMKVRLKPDTTYDLKMS
jgi:hypothetical protein